MGRVGSSIRWHPLGQLYSKFEFFALSSPFFSTQSLPRADRLLFSERVRPTPRLSPLACRGEVKYKLSGFAWRVALRCQFTRDVTALVRALQHLYNRRESCMAAP